MERADLGKNARRDGSETVGTKKVKMKQSLERVGGGEREQI
jgi:hypothetical protein